MKKELFSITNKRKQQLHALRFVPDVIVNKRKVLIWHHGYGEHCERYSPLFEHMAENGIETYTYDCHGHGKSEPHVIHERALVWDFNHLVDDFIFFSESISLSYDINQLFFGGHSLGALVCVHAKLKMKKEKKSFPKLLGLVLHSAALDVVWDPLLTIQAGIGYILSMLFPYLQIVPKKDPFTVSNDIKLVEEFQDDPHGYHYSMRARTAYEILQAFHNLKRHHKDIGVPIYAVHGTSDFVTPLSAVKIFCNSIKSDDVCLKEIEGGYHEMLIGKGKYEHGNNIISWLSIH